MSETQLNLDALANLIAWKELPFGGHPDSYIRLDANAALAVIKLLQPHFATTPSEMANQVESHINDRPEYITALLNSPNQDADYWRWQGQAESRRQLAQKLGWTTPHKPGEATHPAVNGE